MINSTITLNRVTTLYFHPLLSCKRAPVEAWNGNIEDIILPKSTHDI